jgi:hypothetical protein
MKKVTINFKGIPLIVEGYYEKGESRVLYYGDLDGFPGSNSSFDVNEIYVEDSEIDIFELFSVADLEEIETICLTEIED